MAHSLGSPKRQCREGGLSRAAGCVIVGVAIAATSIYTQSSSRLEPIPDKLVVLTFDDSGALPIVEALGFRFARRGGAPEYPYEQGDGVAYEPGHDHPLLLPSAGDARPFWTVETAILQFHGAPDREHPWVHTPPERFEEYMKYLHDEGFKAIAVRDLAKYVDWRQRPDDPWKIIEQRKRGLARPPG